MERIKVFICPKCTQYFFKISNTKHCCEYCRTQLIETKYFLNDFMNENLQKNYPKAIKEYVDVNSLHDPNEETRSYLKKQADEQRKLVEDRIRVESYRKEQEANKPHCPTCNSTDVQKIGTVERGVSVAAFGLFSGKLGKTMKCNHCGYKW